MKTPARLLRRYERSRARSLRAKGERLVLLVPGHARAEDPEHRITDICLYRVHATEGLAKLIDPVAVIFSGWGGHRGRDPEAWQMRDLWRAREIPLLTEEASNSTADNAALTVPLVQAIGNVDAVVVSTSYWHLPRTMLACWVAFWPYGIKVYPLIVWPAKLSWGQWRDDRKLIATELRAFRTLPSDLMHSREFLTEGTRSQLHRRKMDRMRRVFGL